MQLLISKWIYHVHVVPLRPFRIKSCSLSVPYMSCDPVPKSHSHTRIYVLIFHFHFHPLIQKVKKCNFYQFNGTIPEFSSCANWSIIFHLHVTKMAFIISLTVKMTNRCQRCVSYNINRGSHNSPREVSETSELNEISDVTYPRTCHVPNLKEFRSFSEFWWRTVRECCCALLPLQASFKSSQVGSCQDSGASILTQEALDAWMEQPVKCDIPWSDNLWRRHLTYTVLDLAIFAYSASIFTRPCSVQGLVAQFCPLQQVNLSLQLGGAWHTDRCLAMCPCYLRIRVLAPLEGKMGNWLQLIKVGASS